MKRSIFYKIRRKLQCLAYRLTSAEFVSKIYFKHVLKYKLNLQNPQTFNEKIQWLKLYEWPKNPVAIQCADKYKVREYIKKLGKEEILNELFFVWDTEKDIIWEKLPNSFVLKCNHGCGYNIICSNKNELDEKIVKKRLASWLKEDFSLFNAEPHYAKISPKIICEKYLGANVINYNIYCLNGKVVFFSVAGGLGEGCDEFLTYYNADGSIAEFENKAYKSKPQKLTSHLGQMIELAKILAGELPMVRVDFFDIDGNIVFSEMTFTPGGGLIPFSLFEADRKLGGALDISKEKEAKNG